MMFELMHRIGIRSDVAYLGALVSIFSSIAIWANRREKNEARAERFGIFVGLWAPTFLIIGHALREEEARKEA
jgi:hypothetical protein